MTVPEITVTNMSRSDIIQRISDVINERVGHQNCLVTREGHKSWLDSPIGKGPTITEGGPSDAHTLPKDGLSALAQGGAQQWLDHLMMQNPQDYFAVVSPLRAVLEREDEWKNWATSDPLLQNDVAKEIGAGYLRQLTRLNERHSQTVLQMFGAPDSTLKIPKLALLDVGPVQYVAGKFFVASCGNYVVTDSANDISVVKFRETIPTPLFSGMHLDVIPARLLNGYQMGQMVKDGWDGVKRAGNKAVLLDKAARKGIPLVWSRAPPKPGEDGHTWRQRTKNDSLLPLLPETSKNVARLLVTEMGQSLICLVGWGKYPRILWHEIWRPDERTSISLRNLVSQYYCIGQVEADADDSEEGDDELFATFNLCWLHGVDEHATLVAELHHMCCERDVASYALRDLRARIKKDEEQQNMQWKTSHTAKYLNEIIFQLKTAEMLVMLLNPHDPNVHKTARSRTADTIRQMLNQVRLSTHFSVSGNPLRIIDPEQEALAAARERAERWEVVLTRRTSILQQNQGIRNDWGTHNLEQGAKTAKTAGPPRFCDQVSCCCLSRTCSCGEEPCVCTSCGKCGRMGKPSESVQDIKIHPCNLEGMFSRTQWAKPSNQRRCIFCTYSDRVANKCIDTPRFPLPRP